MHPECSTLQKNDAILLALAVWVIGRVDSLIRISLSGLDRLEVVGEELAHALLVAAFLKVHIGHKTLGLSVSIWTFQQHSEVVKTANIALTNIDDKARVSLLLDGDFTSLLFGTDLDAGLQDFNLLFIQV